MKDFYQAILTGVIIGAALAGVANYAHASNASANQGHHGGGNNGAVGMSGGARAGLGASNSSQAGAGQSGQGGSYGTWYLKQSLVDGYQPWPQSEMRQFQKP